jgi:tetratricopeptide (TPR) repeat protein
MGASEEARAVAERALGVASRDLGAPRRAVAHLEASVAHARAAGSTLREGEARISLALAYMRVGATRRALRECERAAAVPGVDKGKLFLNRALIFQRLGREGDALADYDTALAEIRRSADDWTEARVLSNRGVLLAYRGDFEVALSDLERARALHVRLGAGVAAAEVLHNIGFVLARSGDLPGALSRYDEAAADFAALGLARTESLTDRCEVLIEMGLWPEARATAEAAIAGSEAMGRLVDASEARLTLARVCLLQTDYRVARNTAEVARRELVQQRRHSWALLASFLELEARAGEDGTAAPGVARDARRMAHRLERAGWSVAALESLLLAANASLAAGELNRARASLVEAAAARRRGPATLRVRAWHAEAMLRAARGDTSGAFAALRSGLRVVEDHRDSLGATELKVRSRAVGSDIAELGVSLALATGDAGQVFDWIERWRASVLSPDRLRPPPDQELVRMLGELRETVSRARRATLAGRDASAELRRQRSLEASIRRREHSLPGAPAPRRSEIGRSEIGRSDLDGADRRANRQPSEPARRPGRGRETLTKLRTALGQDRALIELLSIGGRLSAVVVTDRRRPDLVELGDLAAVERERASQLFALGRLAHRRGHDAALEAAGAALRESSNRISEYVMAPLQGLVGDRELVIVPTGELHSVVWSLLPGVDARPVTIAPAASLWLERVSPGDLGAVGPRPDPKDVLLVAAPDVATGVQEISTLRRRFYPEATELVGARTRAGEVLAAMEGKALVHMAVHGEFRRDSPQFSSILLTDGGLTVFDLETLQNPPETIVLSACDLGLTHTPAGGEPMGPVAALLGVGVRTVLASVTPVPDDGASEFTVALHESLVGGTSPSRALTAAQQSHRLRSSSAPSGGGLAGVGAATAVAGAGFVCFGAG